MNNSSKFTGVGVALVTPFNTDGTIDFTALANLIESQIAGNIDFLVVLGTTAETPTLTSEEKNQLIKFVAEKVNGRVPLVLGVGGNSTALVVDTIKNGLPEGYDAILSVVPSYNKPSQEGLYRHFTAIADASPLPVILYNVPSRTGVNMTHATTIRLSVHKNIIGIKEASGIVGQAEKIIAGTTDDFIVLSGDDIITLPLMSIGAHGVISVIANALPKEFSQLVHSIQQNKLEEARTMHRKIAPILPLMFTEGNPPGIKCLLALQGKCSAHVRLPLTEVSTATADAIKEKALELNAI